MAKYKGQHRGTEDQVVRQAADNRTRQAVHKLDGQERTQNLSALVRKHDSKKEQGR